MGGTSVTSANGTTTAFVTGNGNVAAQKEFKIEGDANLYEFPRSTGWKELKQAAARDCHDQVFFEADDGRRFGLVAKSLPTDSYEPGMSITIVDSRGAVVASGTVRETDDENASPAVAAASGVTFIVLGALVAAAGLATSELGIGIPVMAGGVTLEGVGVYDLTRGMRGLAGSPQMKGLAVPTVDAGGFSVRKGE